MISSPVTVGANATVRDAIRLMLREEIGRLLVVADGQLVGIVTRADLMRVFSALAAPTEPPNRQDVLDMPVADVMTKDPIVIHPSSPVSTAARILHEHGFQALPVVDRRALIGIVTSQGIIDSLGHHLGADIRGVEMTIDLPNDLVDLHRLTDALTALDPRPGALSLTIRLSKHEHRARLRLASPGPLHVAETFATAGFRVSRLHYEPLPDAEDPA